MHSDQNSPSTSANTSPGPTATEIRRLGAIISGATWMIATIVIVFSVITATGFVAAHRTPLWAAPLIGLAVDAAFVMSLSADSFLSRHALPDAGPWPRALRWFTGGCSIGLNDGLALVDHDWIGVAIHAIAPALLLLLAEAAPAYRRAFAMSLIPVDQSTAVNEPVTAAKPDTATAAKIIEDGWRSGLSVTEVAEQAQRDKSMVSRKFAKLTAQHGSPVTAQ